MRNKSINTVNADFSQNIIRKFLKKFWYIMPKTKRASLARVGNKWRLWWFLVSISWISWSWRNIQRKNFGSKPWVNSYHNFMHWTSNMYLTLSNFCSFNKRSVSGLYLLRVIFRMARFCNLIILLEFRSPSKLFQIVNWKVWVNHT